MRRAGLMAVVAGVLALAGCVERRFVINSDPPGALVLHNNQAIGSAPGDDHFVFYGYHDFTIIKDGYETLHVHQRVPAPWWEYPPFDFVVENLIPLHIEDVRRYNYTLQPAVQPRGDEVLGRATDLRHRGQAIIPPPVPPKDGTTSQKHKNAPPAQAPPPPPPASSPPAPFTP